MAATIVCTCEVCGVQRTESNHWFMAKVKTQITSGRDEGELIVAIVENTGITFMKWDDKLIMSEDYKQLCGMGCMTKLLSTTMGER